MDRDETLFALIGSFRGGKKVTAETRLKRDLRMDSFDFLDLILKLEARFDCAFPDELLGGVSTAGQLALVLDHALDEKERVKNERSL